MSDHRLITLHLHFKENLLEIEGLACHRKFHEYEVVTKTQQRFLMVQQLRQVIIDEILGGREKFYFYLLFLKLVFYLL